MMLKMLKMFLRPARLVALIAVSVVLLPGTLRAELFVYEGFDYTAGVPEDEGLIGESGGTGWTGAWRDAEDAIFQDPTAFGPDPGVDVGAGSLEYTDSQGNQLQTSGNSASFTDGVGFQSPAAYRALDLSGAPASLLTTSLNNGSVALGKDGTSVWMSFMMRNDQSNSNLATSPAWGGMSLYDGDFFDNRLDLGHKEQGDAILPGTTETASGDPLTTWNFGIGSASAASSPKRAFSDTPLNQLSLLVFRFDFNELVLPNDPACDTTPGARCFNPGNIFDDGQSPNAQNVDIDEILGEDEIRLWVNPRLDVMPDDADAVYLRYRGRPFAGDGPELTLSHLRIMNGNRTAGDGQVIDEIRIGETFGDVTPFTAGGLLADFDNDSDVDGADFLEWQRGFGTTRDANDLVNWQAEYGTTAAVAAATGVPEPATWLLVCLAATTFGLRRRRQSS